MNELLLRRYIGLILGANSSFRISGAILNFFFSIFIINVLFSACLFLWWIETRLSCFNRSWNEDNLIIVCRHANIWPIKIGRIFLYTILIYTLSPTMIGQRRTFYLRNLPEIPFPSFLVDFLMIWVNEIYSSFCNFHSSYLFWFFICLLTVDLRGSQELSLAIF